MGLKEIEFYHGCVFSRLAQGRAPVSIRKLEVKSQGFYILNEQLPICIKHTAKKISPWRFTFDMTQQDDLQHLKKIHGSALAIFVCGHDGICCLEFDELKCVLDYVHEDGEWVAVRLRKNEKYFVTGKDGELKRKIADSDFLTKVSDILKLDYDDQMLR